MTASSAARRQRRLKKKLERRGRPRGTFAALLKDPQRFSVATWLLLEPGLGPHRAACLATVLIEETTPIELGTVEGLLSTASAAYRPPPGTSADLDDRARALADKAKLVTSRASESEFDWLSISSGALRARIIFAVAGDERGIEHAVKILRHAGWGKLLARLGHRLDPVGIRPFDQDRLRAAGRKLLEALRERDTLKT
jgi:hypothetical protein